MRDKELPLPAAAGRGSSSLCEGFDLAQIPVPGEYDVQPPSVPAITNPFPVELGRWCCGIDVRPLNRPTPCPGAGVEDAHHVQFPGGQHPVFNGQVDEALEAVQPAAPATASFSVAGPAVAGAPSGGAAAGAQWLLGGCVGVRSAQTAQRRPRAGEAPWGRWSATVGPVR